MRLKRKTNTAPHLFWFGENRLDETDTSLNTLAWAFAASRVQYGNLISARKPKNKEIRPYI